MELLSVKAKTKLTTKFASAVFMVAGKQTLIALGTSFLGRCVGIQWWGLTIAMTLDILRTGGVVTMERSELIRATSAQGWNIINRCWCNHVLINVSNDVYPHWSSILVYNSGLPLVLHLLNGFASSKVRWPSLLPIHLPDGMPSKSLAINYHKVHNQPIVHAM